METIYLALRVLLSLAVVLAAIWYVHRRLTRGGRIPRATKTVTVVTKQSVGSKASVVVMDVDGQRFLLGVTEQAVTVLNTSDTPSAEPLPQRSTAGSLPSRFTPGGPADRNPADRNTAEPSIPVVPVSATRSSGGAAFARVLSELQSETDEQDGPAPVVYLPGQRTTPLDGSILSPATWKRTAAALRRAP